MQQRFLFPNSKFCSLLPAPTRTKNHFRVTFYSALDNCNIVKGTLTRVEDVRKNEKKNE